MTDKPNLEVASGGETLVADADAFAHKTEIKRRRRSHKMPGEDIGGLNLTAMMDMMTILLVFLVKSYTTDPERVNVSDTLSPPKSTAIEALKPAVTITVSSETIMVDDKVVLGVNEITPQMLSKALIPVLQDALTTRAATLKELEARGGPTFDGSLLVVAHKATPYDILTTVLYTAGQAKFSNYRLLVQKK